MSWDACVLRSEVHGSWAYLASSQPWEYKTWGLILFLPRLCNAISFETARETYQEFSGR